MTRPPKLWPQHTEIAPIVREHCRLTIRAREALEAAGASIEQTGDTWTVRLGLTMPTGLVGCLARGDGCQYDLAVRTADEPDWPDQLDNFWCAVDWLPCPVCGAPLVWYEPGYIRYRICARRPHHHILAT